jgi:hypothetical protein
MVCENKCHVILDPEIAELFESEAARGGGCAFSGGPGIEIRELYTPEEAECLKLLESQGFTLPG